MKVTQIQLENFRNHAATIIHLAEGVNLLTGRNGAGKTNILEALSYLGLTKSFFGARDNVVLQIGASHFEVGGTILSDAGIEHQVRVVFERDSEHKVVTVNRAQQESMAAVIGRFPVVVLAPEHALVTTGPPAERRKFLDLLLSQVSRVYLDDLMQYRKALKQRNRLLLDAREGKHVRSELIDPWTAALINHGSRVIQRRSEFITEFQSYLARAYALLGPAAESPTLNYSTLDGFNAVPAGNSVTMAFANALESSTTEEIRRGMTLVGPHRDELEISLGSLTLQRYASQGQHKTFLTALKIAEFNYLRERMHETPLLLLDDLFSELDEERAGRVLELLDGLGQVVVTATEDRVFGKRMQWGGRQKKFVVSEGTCRES
jgi:DNA replication and repair protein RecF